MRGSRRRRLLLLAAMFAFQAQALAREWYDVWRDVFQVGVCAAGLLLLLALSPRHPRASEPATPPGDGLTTRGGGAGATSSSS